MPLYDYRCSACNSVSEIRHGFNEEAGPCPGCGGALVRQFHAAPIVFKGSGFYVTDSRPSSASSGSSEASASSTDAACSAPKECSAAKKEEAA